MKPFRGIAGALAAIAGLSSASALAGEAAHRGALVVTGLRTVGFEDAGPQLREGIALLIEEGRIVYSGPAAGLPPAEGALRVDGAGLTALPGLADMHVHVWDEAELGAYLAHGVTTVRNMSGMPFHLRLAQRIAAGELAGPRLLTTGPILNSAGPNQQINHQLVETAEQGRAAVRAQHAAGFTDLKLYSNLKRAPPEAILQEAALLGMSVSGHPPEGERSEGIPFEKPFAISFEEVLDDGFLTIEHSESIAWHGLSDSHDEEQARALARRIAASGAAVTPTLLAYENLVLTAESRGAFANRPGIEWLNPLIRQTEVEMVDYWSSAEPEGSREHAAFLGRFTAMMQQEGVPLVAGSDAGIFLNLPGESLLDELALLVRGGLTPWQALRSATHNVAQLLGEAGTSGCLGEGCRADLVLYRCDPLADISCTREPAAVIRAGRFHSAEQLSGLLDGAARHDPQRTGQNLLEGMAAQGTPIDPAMLGL